MRGHLAGFYHAQFWKRDSAGYPVGVVADPNNISNGTTSHSYLLTGPVEASAPQPTRERATFRGGQAYLGAKDLGVSDFGQFDLTLSAIDDVFNTHIRRGAVDTTIASARRIHAPNTQGAPVQGGLMLTTSIQDVDTGASEWMHIIYPSRLRRRRSASTAPAGRIPTRWCTP
jgi:hypothetical protein